MNWLSKVLAGSKEVEVQCRAVGAAEGEGSRWHSGIPSSWYRYQVAPPTWGGARPQAGGRGGQRYPGVYVQGQMWVWDSINPAKTATLKTMRSLERI